MGKVGYSIFISYYFEIPIILIFVSCFVLLYLQYTTTLLTTVGAFIRSEIHDANYQLSWQQYIRSNICISNNCNVQLLDSISIDSYNLQGRRQFRRYFCCNNADDIIINNANDIGTNYANANRHSNSITIMDGPFHSNQLKEYWGRHPLLIRKAFDVTHEASGKQQQWPTFDDMIQLATTTGRISQNDGYIKNDDNGTNAVRSSSLVSSPAESVRLIRHVPNQLDTYTLHVGPFTMKQFNKVIQQSKKWKWTIVINDVERYYPKLESFMNEHFAFLPRWRRDDAQISISTTSLSSYNDSNINGSSIGPHVDNYDVFLIQTTGMKLWKIITEYKLTQEQEQELLIPDIPVSILNVSNSPTDSHFGSINHNDFVDLILYPGDMLYLPPRIVHWGIGIGDDDRNKNSVHTTTERPDVSHTCSTKEQCMTLSVGARAPSVSDILLRGLTEYIADQSTLSSNRMNENNSNTNDTISYLLQHRHVDDTSNLLFDCFPSKDRVQHPSLTVSVKDTMRTMVQNTINSILNDDDVFDMIIGKVITEPIRYSDSHPISFVDQITTYESSPFDIIQSMKRMGGNASLQKAPGISTATSQVIRYANNSRILHHRLYVNGVMYEVPTTNVSTATTCCKTIFKLIDNCLPIYGSDICNIAPSDPLFSVLLNLIQDGILQVTINE